MQNDLNTKNTHYTSIMNKCQRFAFKVDVCNRQYISIRYFAIVSNNSYLAKYVI